MIMEGAELILDSNRYKRESNEEDMTVIVRGSKLTCINNISIIVMDSQAEVPVNNKQWKYYSFNTNHMFKEKS